MATTYAIRKESADDGRDFLINDKDQLIYYFLPKGLKAVPKIQLLPGATQDWAALWSPVTVDEGDLEDKKDQQQESPSIARYVNDTAIKYDADVKKEHFGAVDREYRGRRLWHVHWGGKHAYAANSHVFWGLYTYSFDRKIGDYSFGSSYPEAIRVGAWPPGWIPSLWVPASISDSDGAPEPDNGVRLNDPLGGPVGEGYGGGP